jgi:hypothetical protein
VNIVDILISPEGLGLVFVVIFLGSMIVFAVAGKNRPGQNLREIAAFSRLGKAIGLAVEAGRRLHISLGWGGVSGVQGTSGLLGLSLVERIARLASISDRPPVVTSGEGTLGILSQDTLSMTYRAIGEARQYDSGQGRLSGLTPFSYAAGVLPNLFDEHVTATVLAGHFGSEVALIADAAERSDGMTLAGSDSIQAQAVLIAAAQEPLIGEELFAAGAYVNAGPLHASSLRAQDIFRWVLIVIILAGAALKLVGLL